MQRNAFDVLIGLRLSIVRRAADMLVLHFGDIRPHPSGDGTIGAYALHVQCAWRFDGPNGTITGRADLWDYAGPGERPAHWSHEHGGSLQDRRFAGYFVRDEATQSWVNDDSQKLIVTGAAQSPRGDIALDLSGGCGLAVFPTSSRGEAWRLFAPGRDAEHLIFPTGTGDFAIKAANLFAAGQGHGETK